MTIRINGIAGSKDFVFDYLEVMFKDSSIHTIDWDEPGYDRDGNSFEACLDGINIDEIPIDGPATVFEEMKVVTAQGYANDREITITDNDVIINKIVVEDGTNCVCLANFEDINFLSKKSA